MEPKKIQKILAKYLVDEAGPSELEALEKWLEDPGNESEFAQYVKIDHLVNRGLGTSKPKDILTAIEELRRKQDKKERSGRVKRIYRYAAVLAGLLLASAYFMNVGGPSGEQRDDGPNQLVKVKVEPGKDRAVLTLQNGSEVALDNGVPMKTKDAESDGSSLVYQTEGKGMQGGGHHYLTVPRGGQFHLVLADGSEVWLNSGSQLKYPVRFVPGRAREVELVYGEAYFDVSPSSEHGGSVFEVSNRFQRVSVIGTEFNIKAYAEETNILTTLVEGKVQVGHGNEQRYLSPEEQLDLHTASGTSTIRNIEVYDEVAWKNGIFSFHEKELGDIMAVLSRWYDVEVVFNQGPTQNETFTGVLRKSQNLEEILEIVKNFKVIEGYTVANGKVTIY